MCVQPMWNLRELGLSDLGAQQLDELVNSVLPRLSPQETPRPLAGQTAWRTSHLSTHSFYYNKHGENVHICYQQAFLTVNCAPSTSTKSACFCHDRL